MGEGDHRLSVRFCQPKTPRSVGFNLPAGVLTINHFGLLVAATTAPPLYVFRLDSDNDGDLDNLDFAIFADCFNQAGNPPRCEYREAVMFDADADGDVDNLDFRAVSINM